MENLHRLQMNDYRSGWAQHAGGMIPWDAFVTREMMGV